MLFEIGMIASTKKLDSNPIVMQLWLLLQPTNELVSKEMAKSRLEDILGITSDQPAL